ncbi:MAG TPA: ATP-binding cassette domain-containing protein [Terriglobales bacterium]|nr:ATP-binding cassette domain-containing protein [Terriglobales bacterium]
MNTLTVEIRLRLSTSFHLDCAFEITQGFTVLFGHSGAGKTSVLDCIAGLKVPDSGRIAIDGVTVFDSAKRLNQSPAERRLAYVFQSLALFPHLSVEENIAYGLRDVRASERQERYQEILSHFGIDHLKSRQPADLSGGERQRVALARSLITDPRALLLDEPLAALDRPARMKILNSLQAWNHAHGVPILYVTHSVREALALGERVLVMQDGRMATSGKPSELLDPEDWD